VTEVVLLLELAPAPCIAAPQRRRFLNSSELGGGAVLGPSIAMHGLEYVMYTEKGRNLSLTATTHRHSMSVCRDPESPGLAE
jgi:hypothetical protein